MESAYSVNGEACDGPFTRRPPRTGPMPILDVVHLRTYTAGDRAFEREILGLFTTELAKTMDALGKASTPREWHMAAHTLKGSSLSVGANRLAQAARAAEHLGAPGHGGCAAAIAAIEREIAEVHAEIARLKLA